MRDIEQPLTLFERQQLPFITLCYIAPFLPWWAPFVMQCNVSRFSFGSETLLEVRFV